MLPDSSLGRIENMNIAKFADTGIPVMIDQLKLEGVQPYKLHAKIAGGAQMFQFSSNKDSMRIGPRNVEAVKEYLKKYSIPIIAEDTGGNSGRTIEFDPITTLLNIRTVNQGNERYLMAGTILSNFWAALIAFSFYFFAFFPFYQCISYSYTCQYISDCLCLFLHLLFVLIIAYVRKGPVLDEEDEC